MEPEENGNDLPPGLSGTAGDTTRADSPVNDAIKNQPHTLGTPPEKVFCDSSHFRNADEFCLGDRASLSSEVAV